MKIPKAELLQLKPHPFICMKNLLIKKLEIEKTKPTSTFKTDITKADLFLFTKLLREGNWSMKKILTLEYLITNNNKSISK